MSEGTIRPGFAEQHTFEVLENAGFELALRPMALSGKQTWMLMASAVSCRALVGIGVLRPSEQTRSLERGGIQERRSRHIVVFVVAVAVLSARCLIEARTSTNSLECG